MARVHKFDHRDGDLTVHAALNMPQRSGRAGQAVEEIDALRSMNAHLLRQIAVLKRREAEALRMADRDGLTGLFNRRRMLDLLANAIDAAMQQDVHVGVLFIDLDGFKHINDANGHGVGDRILMSVASRLSARTRAGDVVCRYGGDEFVVILPRVADLAAAQEVADSIRKRIAVPYRIDGVEMHLTAAIGTSIYPEDARTASGLLQAADESMYREKSRWVGVERDADTATPARRYDDRPRGRATT
jgi:diguanylate cyclase (GGDEF)-like protein